MHCVETAAIVECLHATSRLDEMDERWVDASVLCPGYAGPLLDPDMFLAASPPVQAVWHVVPSARLPMLSSV